MASLVTFSGLDGAGKTTQISLFLDYLERRSARFCRLQMYDDVSIAARLRRLLHRRESSSEEDAPSRSSSPSGAAASRTADGFRLDKNRTDLPTVVARKLVYLLDLLHFLVIRRRRAVAGRDVVVMDRYFFDSLANLLSGTSWTYPYVAAFLRLVPTPDLAVLLDVEPETALRRKPEYPLEYLKIRRNAYHRIFSRVDGALIADGEQDPQRIHDRIVRRAEALLADEQPRSDR